MTKNKSASLATQNSESEPGQEEAGQSEGHVQFQDEVTKYQWHLEKALREKRELEQQMAELRTQFTQVSTE